MMLRSAPVSPSPSPNKVSSSSTRISTFAAPCLQLVTRKAPNFIPLLCCSNVYANNSILAKPLKYEPRLESPHDFPFIIEGNVMTRELNREEIRATITFKLQLRWGDEDVLESETIGSEEDLSESESIGSIGSEEEDVSESESIGSEEQVTEPESIGGVGVFPPEGMVLNVKISKGNGMSVTFEVNLWPHDMKVDFFTVKTLGMPELEIKMEEEEKEPRKLWESAIQEYLKVRGIKPCYADYLHKYMVYTDAVLYC